MTADIDQLTREALNELWDNISLNERQAYDGTNAILEHAIRFTLSRYAPHELPDPVKELATKLRAEWMGGACDTEEAMVEFFIRRTREEDAK